MTRRSAAAPKPTIAPAPPVSTALAVASITALAALLRLWHFGQSPPGLNQDEAVNAWNAWCLLKTGRDMVGAAWPVFYAHAIGDNRTTLYFYALLPFQAIGGLSAITTRLPLALRHASTRAQGTRTNSFRLYAALLTARCCSRSTRGTCS
jgi:predicted membrane-bound mannosyltransferase